MKLLRLFGLTLAISVVVFGCGRAEKLKITYTYPGDKEMWNQIFKVKEPYKFESVPLGVILPHHLIVAEELAKTYTGLAAVTQPKLIVVISPNHYEDGEADIQTCEKCEFQTTNGPVEMDDDFNNGLVKAGVADFNDDTFIKEHGIYNHAPFIKKYFPEAKIVPIVLKWKIPKEKVEALANWLDKNLPVDALVVTSVDFSHYVPLEVADFHDWSSYATIKNFNYDNVYDLEIDSPSSIYAMLKLMEKRGYKKAERFAHTNLQDYVSHRESTTSHQFFSFYKGAADVVKSVTIANFESMPVVNNGLSFNKGWFWDINKNPAKNDRDWNFLKNLRGQEDRFLVGSDFMIFDLESGKCREEEQNSMKIAFCKFSESDDEKTLADELKKIKNKKNKVDLVYLLYQFNAGNKPNIAQRDLTEKFADAGADIFVGSGLKEIVPMEIYKKSLVFYSLGDSLSIGIVASLGSFYVYLFPLQITYGYPELLDFEQRADFLKNFVRNISGASIRVDEKKMLIKVAF
ncbi:AmmeMemoRadiSam system protein B [Candidatus Peregrinibacteria bacterium]|nr:AmmeMemoRadiSam system protein B [Candidatus Peregrinibacteria bacterium]